MGEKVEGTSRNMYKTHIDKARRGGMEVGMWG